MADTYEKDLGQKSSLTTSDFIRVVGSDNVSYKQLLSNVLATGGMGELITSSGGWQSDNAITAFENAYASWANNTVHVGVIKAGSVAAYIAFKADAQYGAAYFLTYGSGFAQEYTRNIYGGTWGNIITLPTRAEMNTLNNMFTDIAWKSNADLNNFTTTGVYWISTGATNAPAGNWYPIWVMAKGDTVRQIAIIGNDTIHSRSYQSRVWSDWTRLPSRGEIDALGSKTTGTIAKYSGISDGTLDSASLIKVGNTVFGSARIYSFSATANGSFFEIPTGFRPITLMRVMGYIYVNNVAIPTFLSINPNGMVSLAYSSNQTLTQIGFAGSWTVK